MFRIAFRSVLAALALATVARADPVINPHPRLLLTAAEKSRLVAKKNIAVVDEWKNPDPCDGSTQRPMSSWVSFPAQAIPSC